MSQHDQNIANDTGAAVRGDINNALAALFSTSSGASAPATTLAQQFWADTTANLLKQRNAANTGWLVRGTLAETFVIARSSDTILGVGDFGRVVIATGTFTQTLTAAATLGDGWHVGYRNDGSGVITIDPNGAETIDGGTTITLQPSEACLIYCNGTSFKTIGRRRINDLTEDTSPDSANDFVETWDASAGAHKKVKVGNVQKSGWVLILRQAVSGVALVDFIDLDATYDHYILTLHNVIPATDNTNLLLRTSTDNGANFASGATDYSVARIINTSGASVPTGASGVSESSIALASQGLGNAAGESFNAFIRFGLGSAALRPLFNWQFAQFDSTPALANGIGSGTRNATALINAIRLQQSSGNISSGTFALYGVKIN